MSSTKSLAQDLADFTVQAKFDDLPQPVVHEAKRVILDSLGCALAGMTTDKGSLAIKLTLCLGGRAEASIIGSSKKVSCAEASFANGELINALDFDSILPPVIHVAPFVLPSALALGESQKASGRQVILATVLGHEMSSRVGSGLSRPRRIIAEGPNRGKMQWLPVYGYSANVFGSAAAAGKMLGLDNVQMAHAFGIAAYNAPMQTGAQWHDSGTDAMIKYGSPGWVAKVGLTAALLAETGYTGDINVLDGEHSFWKFAGSETWSPEKVQGNRGREWHITNTRYKVYPCCGIIQGSLDCLIDILKENHLEAGDIEKIQVWLDPGSAAPLWQNRRAENEVQAQFSIPYVIAVGASGLGYGKEWQDAATRNDPGIQELADRVSFFVHPDYETVALSSPGSQMAKVEVHSRGRAFSKETYYARGSATPAIARMSDEELEAKFRRNADGVLGEEIVNEVVRIVWSLDQIDDVSRLMSLLTK